MIVLAFDPGQTTGYAVLSTDGEYQVLGSFAEWYLVDALMGSYEPDVVVIEQFRLYPYAARSKVWSDFPTVEVIGVIKYLAERHSIPFVMQSAADVKVINLVYTKQKKGDRHAYSALRHALLYLRRQGADSEFRNLYNIRARGHTYR